MKDAQKPDHVSLNTLIGRLKEGRFVIPDFQREFEWKPWDIKRPDAVDLPRLLHRQSSALEGQERELRLAVLRDHLRIRRQDRQLPWNYGTGAPSTSSSMASSDSPPCTTPSSLRMSRCRTGRTAAVYFVHVDKFMDEEYDEAFEYDWTFAPLQQDPRTIASVQYRRAHLSALRHRSRRLGPRRTGCRATRSTGSETAATQPRPASDDSRG